VIGAFAIIISLIDVAVQVSDNTRAIRSAVLNDASMGIQSWCLDISNNEQSSEVFQRGVRNPDDLTEAEMFQFFMSAHGAIPGFQNAFELFDEGTLDEDVNRSITMSLLATRNLPGFELFLGITFRCISRLSFVHLWTRSKAWIRMGWRRFIWNQNRGSGIPGSSRMALAMSSRAL